MIRVRHLTGLVALSALLTAGVARAFDSAPTTSNHFRTLGPPPPPKPFSDGFFSYPPPHTPPDPVSGGGDDYVRLCEKGYDWDYRDRFFECWSPVEVQAGASKNAYSLSYMRYANKTPFYLQICTGPDPATSLCSFPTNSEAQNDLDLDIGWVRVRRAWDLRGAEHRQIYEQAVAVAGIPAKVVNTFWTQYGASRRLLSSPIPKTSFSISGPSWLPVAPQDAKTIVARPVDALDLAQLPDTSHALWDWAGGNEICPFDELPFDADQKLNLCHDFASVMGAVNANHFLPMSRHYWHYYHRLALQQASRCSSMATQLEPLISRLPGSDLDWEAGPIEDKSLLNTEVHECERVAMLWEAVAQHYLQDAWSTGHMFRRWGTPDLKGFPSSFTDDTPELLGQLTPADKSARQLLIADITAVYSGTIHGAKGVLDGLIAAGKEHNNDPLCAPFWEKYVPRTIEDTTFDPYIKFVRPTQWMDEESDVVHQGAGDLFLQQILEPHGADLSEGIGLAEQKSRLLGCTAGSAREVYAALPQWTGPLGPAVLSDGVLLYDPDSDDCWHHWATNESMNAAHNITFQGIDLGPFNVDFTDDEKQNLIRPSVLNKIVTLIPGTQVPLRYDGPEGLPLLHSTTAMASLLIKAAKDVERDINSISLFYAEQAAEDAESGIPRTTTAQQKTVSFLNVDPGLDATSLDAPPSSYSDRPGSGLPRDELVPRMFPRAFLKETCEQGGSIPSLKNRCKTVTDGQGDAAACTMCVRLVKNWMQGCPHWDRSPRDPSLCDAIGVTTGRPPQPILPEQYTNGSDASDSMDRCTGANKDTWAEAYCTGWSDQGRDWCDKQVVSFDFKQEVPEYLVGTWLDEHVIKQNLCGQYGIDQHTDWDDRLQQQQAWLGRPYFGAVDVESPGVGRISPEFQRNYRGSGQAPACGARQAAVVARGSCASLYSGAGLTLPTGFAPGAPYFGETQDLMEVIGPIPDHLHRDDWEPYCSARLPVASNPVACPAGLTCQPDGFCRSTSPELLVLKK